jgi:hypothetical protein
MLAPPHQTELMPWNHVWVITTVIWLDIQNTLLLFLVPVRNVSSYSFRAVTQRGRGLQKNTQVTLVVEERNYCELGDNDIYIGHSFTVVGPTCYREMMSKCLKT